MLTEPYIKEKIGAHLSYPATFTELQRFLTPPLDKLHLEVWFRAWKAPRRNERRERYAVLEARYSPPPPGATWKLVIRPVPLQIRGTVHALLPAALSRIHDWLLAPRSSVWYSFGHAIFFDFISDSQQLTAHEFNKV